ncbi:MAG: hypothetical protein ABI823_08135 [Bryobacteraceae bacterium]
MEIKANIDSGSRAANIEETSAARKASDARDRKSDLGIGSSNDHGDRVTLSSAGSDELQRALRVEALGQTVADGAYDPPSKEVAHKIVASAIHES